MALAIHKLLRQQPLDAAAIKHFLRSHTFPIVEGPHVTFVFHGHVHAVFLRHWVFGLASHHPFRRIGDSPLWYHTLELPPDSRVEYKLEIHNHGNSEWIQDPLNPNHARDPFGANSVCHSQGYSPPDWVYPDPEARTGTLENHILHNTPFGDHRRLTLYVPARFRPTRRYRLLIVHDGGDYLRYAAFKEVLDNLIHRLEVAPMIVAFTYPGDRLVEYAHDALHHTFITEHVVPWISERFPLYDRASARTIMGASFGAVAALSSAWLSPGVFGNLFLQSGSFAFTDIGENRRGPLFNKVVDFINLFRENPGRPAERVFVSCGVYESLIYENRSMVPLLQSTGMDVRYVEARDGHNWENWRDRLRAGLSWLHPGPLWMTYE